MKEEIKTPPPADQQLADATFWVVIQLLQMLHERGILPLQDVVSRLEAHHYSSVAGHEFGANPYLQKTIDSLQRIADAYAQSKKPPI